MPSFTPIPLGERIPPSLHAVSCSLPTMASVRGYEERKPEVMRQLTSGYPRFVVHPFLQQLARKILLENGLDGQTLWLTSSAQMAGQLARHLSALSPAEGGPVTLVTDGVVKGVAHPNHPEVALRAKVFLQNIGGFLSSRTAEAELFRRGLLKSRQQETRREPLPDAVAEIRRVLDPLHPGAELFLANSGMNAIYAAFRAVSSIQAARGRTTWVQLGWLYLDTIAILRKFTATPGDYVYLGNVFDRAAWEKLFAERGDSIAGVFIEAPTNPLIQMPGLAELSALARRSGAAVVIDPSVNSAFNLDVFPHADVVVSSLTKYTASEGDVIAGVAAVNPASPHAAALRKGIAESVEPTEPADIGRLAAQIGDAPRVVAAINAGTVKVAQFLEKHPGVSSVYWALHPASRDNYLRVARHPGAVGGMISFSVRGGLERFYDRLRLPKGPSFGMKRTLICPFMYLAHYDLVTSTEGRAELKASGLDPDLLRLCVGIEPPADIIAALAEALV